MGDRRAFDSQFRADDTQPLALLPRDYAVAMVIGL
jgi:hypothetical protein